MVKFATLTVAFFISQFAFAHGDHPPRIAKCVAKECTESEIRDAASSAVKAVAQRDPKKSSWASAKLEKVEKRQFKKGSEWVAVFTDESKPKAEQSLYVFITLDGYLNGSNFTGQ